MHILGSALSQPSLAWPTMAAGGRERPDTSVRKCFSHKLRVMRGPIYYIAGPPAMVAATSQTLGNAGVNENDVRTEELQDIEKPGICGSSG
jgi:hypothetical protein